MSVFKNLTPGPSPYMERGENAACRGWSQTIPQGLD
jgi:hypothetical protein